MKGPGESERLELKPTKSDDEVETPEQIVSGRGVRCAWRDPKRLHGGGGL